MQTAVLPRWTARAPYRLCWSTITQRSRVTDLAGYEGLARLRQPRRRFLATNANSNPGRDLPPSNTKEQEKIVGQDGEETYAQDPHAALEGQHESTKQERARTDEAVARRARLVYGDTLPEGVLQPAQLQIYTRLYGEPIFDMDEAHDAQEAAADSGTGVMVEGPDGALEEVEFDDDGTQSFEDMLSSPDFVRLRKSKLGKFFARAKKQELDDKILFAEMNKVDEAALVYLEKDWRRMDQDERAVYIDDVRYMKLEQYLRDQGRDEEADELLQCLYIFIENRAIAKGELAREVETAEEEQPDQAEEQEEQEQEEDQDQDEDGDDEGQIIRTHPLTAKNRFSTFPAAVQLPKSSFTGPVSAIISGTSPTHLSDAAQRIFGGRGLPYSPSNPHFSRSLPQKPIALDVTQDKMSDIDADAYFAAVMPGTYGSLMSVLVETRKRLGSEWLPNLMNKPGGPRILDAGSGGAGVIAFREMLRAEWERINDNSDDPDASKDVATVDGREGGALAEAPRVKATVLIAGSTLRQRASVLLDNTTFIPRLPDYVHASDPHAAQQGKFDVILAPHSLWSLKEDYLRKQHVANLWSLLQADGGVLILLEKGVPRGFEVIAGARKFLLDTRIASPGAETAAEELASPESPAVNLQGVRQKEAGMIIAPCTNHGACPMYPRPGVSHGRKDYCHFEQRYVRPPYLQKLLGAKSQNHEDVKFSYLSVVRGRDQRLFSSGTSTTQLVQDASSTLRAFAGYEHPAEPVFDPSAPALADIDAPSASAPHSLSLPRLILPPLKRTGHVILDVCTPAATLERWTVARSTSKQAFRDARKAAWGDLWALGAKTRTPKNVSLGGGAAGKGHGLDLKSVRVSGKAKKVLAEEGGRGRRDVYELDEEGGVKDRLAGRMRRGQKVSGVRDRRNKSGKVRVRKGEQEEG